MGVLKAKVGDIFTSKQCGEFIVVEYINYKAEVDSSGYFKEQLNIDEMKFSIYYKAFDVIGEHSHKTNKISFN